MTRPVRVTDQFWSALKATLPERPGSERPSWRVFEQHDLPTIKARFGEYWDEFTAYIPGRDDYRHDIGLGVCGQYVVEAQLARDGAIELVAVRVDTEGLAEPEPDA